MNACQCPSLEPIAESPESGESRRCGSGGGMVYQSWVRLMSVLGARKAGARAPLNTPPRHAACPDARGPLCQAPHLQFRAIASSGHTWVLSGDDPGLLAQVLGPRRPGAANSPPEVCHRICRTAH